MTLITIFICKYSLSIADIYEPILLRNVTDKKYNYKNELTLQIGVLPVGAFNKHMTMGVDYLNYFKESSYFLNIFYAKAFEFESSLKNTLISDFNADPNSFLVLDSITKAGIGITPFYTKNLFFNSSQIYSRTSFILNFGQAQYTIQNVPFVSIGMTQAFYKSSIVSFKYGFEYVNFIDPVKYLDNQFLINLGAVFAWGQND